MLDAIYRAIAVIIFLISSIPAFSQNFYVNAWKDINKNENLTYEFIVGQCDIPSDSMDMKIYTCKATGQPHPNWIDSAYTDIAIDASQNLWYVTLAGYLYTRKLDDTASCKYVGTFLDTPATFSGLVADKNGTIYAAASRGGHSVLYKYDAATGFKYLGKLPKGVVCSGDLFFYKQRLFMTCVDNKVDSFFVYEIALADPSQSCYYMSLNGMAAPWAAFSANDGIKDRVFIVSIDTANYTSSQLFEIDMDNRHKLFSICKYPFLIRGAAAYYDATSDTTHCPFVPNSVAAKTQQHEELTIYNPSNQTIRINTSLSDHDIRSICLYDVYGKRVSQYSTNNFPDNMTTGDLPDGMYLLHIAAKDGRQWKEKIVKDSRW